MSDTPRTDELIKIAAGGISTQPTIDAIIYDDGAAQRKGTGHE